MTIGRADANAAMLAASRSRPRVVDTNRSSARGREAVFASSGPYNAHARRRAKCVEPGGRPRLAVRGSARAKVAELVDALDLGSSGVTLESSSLSFRTTRWDAPIAGSGRSSRGLTHAGIFDRDRRS
jgi:hypothetical protein